MFTDFARVWLENLIIFCGWVCGPYKGMRENQDDTKNALVLYGVA